MRSLLIVMLLSVLTACGGSPEAIQGASGPKGDTGSQGLKGDPGASGIDGVAATSELSIQSVSTCENSNVSYRVGTQIDYFYQEVTYSNGMKLVICELKYLTNYVTHSQYLKTSDSKYAASECRVKLDVNDTSGGYWKFTNDKKVLYIDGNSAVAGLIYDISAQCVN